VVRAEASRGGTAGTEAGRGHGISLNAGTEVGVGVWAHHNVEPSQTVFHNACMDVEMLVMFMRTTVLKAVDGGSAMQ
jgi:hypothetical protein